MSGRFAFAWGAASHPGQVRSINQDSALAEDGLFAVADGMGGHAAGEVASQVAVEALRGTGGDSLVEAVRLANRAVWERAEHDDALRGMGTTLCAVALLDGDGEPRVAVANVGDSRVYLHRDGDLMQLTDDHSLVAELEREGRLTAEEAKVHPQRNIVTRVLGNEPDVDVDTWIVDPLRGDRFLLCSDGLFNEVDEDDISAVLRRQLDPQAAADELVDAANRAGGRDNITVVVVDIVDDEGKAQRASVALGASEGAEAASSATASAAVAPVDPERSAGRRSAAGRRAAATGNGGDEPRRQWVTWRSALFVLVVLAVLAAAVGSVTWYARNTYFVGVEDDQVAIFKGRPGGLLWLDPTLEETTELGVEEVPPARRDDVLAGKEQPTLEEARRYVANLERQAEERRAATTTTTTTTTTVPPTTAPPTTAAATPGP